VLSSDHSAEHLRGVADRLGRKPLIWDNYPVNDASRLTDFLHLAPFRNNIGVLRQHSRGQMANAMNQAMLSRVPLHTLASLYRRPAASAEELLAAACKDLCSPGLAAALLEDAALFQQVGLAGMSEAQKRALRQKYARLTPEPPAHEVVAWLDGQY